MAGPGSIGVTGGSMLGSFKRILTDGLGKLRFRFHRRILRKSLRPVDGDYEKYLEVQLKRTLLKNNETLPARAVSFIDWVAAKIDLQRCLALCVGCRNIAEIDRLRAKGAAAVTGIDLFSRHHPDIRVMDMHRMTFADDSFDLVYSSHSLEHSLEPVKAVEEMIRVVRDGGFIAIEVPVGYQTQGADLVDFRSLENLVSLFGEHLHAVPWSENPRKDILRAIITVRKNGGKGSDPLPLPKTSGPA